MRSRRKEETERENRRERHRDGKGMWGEKGQAPKRQEKRERWKSPARHQNQEPGKTPKAHSWLIHVSVW